jgi:hypothetical protein
VIFLPKNVAGAYLEKNLGNLCMFERMLRLKSYFQIGPLKSSWISLFINIVKIIRHYVEGVLKLDILTAVKK